MLCYGFACIIVYMHAHELNKLFHDYIKTYLQYVHNENVINVPRKYIYIFVMEQHSNALLQNSCLL